MKGSFCACDFSFDTKLSLVQFIPHIFYSPFPFIPIFTTPQRTLNHQDAILNNIQLCDFKFILPRAFVRNFILKLSQKGHIFMVHGFLSRDFWSWGLCSFHFFFCNNTPKHEFLIHCSSFCLVQRSNVK